MDYGFRNGQFLKYRKMEKESALVTVYFLKAPIIIIISIIVVIFSI